MQVINNEIDIFDEPDPFRQSTSADGFNKKNRKSRLTVDDVISRPKSANFNNTRLALLCNPKGDYIKPLFNKKKDLPLEVEAMEHALMRLRLQAKDLNIEVESVSVESVSKPKPPSPSRASHFPSSTSRSVQLSRNRSVKSAMLVEAIPATADPVLVPRIVKVPSADPAQKYGAGSLPLEFSKHFGEKGRRSRAEAEEQSKRTGPPPPRSG